MKGCYQLQCVGMESNDGWMVYVRIAGKVPSQEERDSKKIDRD